MTSRHNKSMITTMISILHHLKISIPVAFCFICAGVHAQDLSTEITVDRIVEPSQRMALRPALSPQLLSPQLQSGYPKAAEWLQPGTVTPLLTRLGAARWEDSIPHAHYKGYLGGGYFPALNFGADAGYRFIDTSRAWLGGAFQYRGIDYSRDGYDLNHQEALLAFDGGFRPNDFSALTARLSYRYDRVQEPFFDDDSAERFYYTQTANDFEASAAWLSQPGRISYDIGMTVGNFRFTEASPSELAAQSDPLSQTMVDFRIGVGISEGERGLAVALPRRYGVDVEGTWQHTNTSAGTLGLWHVKPYARFGRDSFKGRAGLNLSIASGAGTSLQIAPEVDLSYSPADKPFAASLALTGGKQLNFVRDLFALDPYLCPVASYGFSRVLMDLEASVVFGPVAGFEVEAFGGFALPREWLMPAVTSRRTYGGTVFAGVNAESMRVGARMKYSFKSFFSLGASAECAHSEDGLMSWYRWRDSAKYVFAAWAEAHPMAGLEIGLRWDLRRCRSILEATGFEEVLTRAGRFDLGNASCVTAKASYVITPQLTAFVNAEIHNKYLLISAMPAPTLTGLAGVSFKF